MGAPWPSGRHALTQILLGLGAIEDAVDLHRLNGSAFWERMLAQEFRGVRLAQWAIGVIAAVRKVDLVGLDRHLAA